MSANAPASFQDELQALINKHSQENASGTPDFILADYLSGCLALFSKMVNRREEWYGRQQDQFGMPKNEGLVANYDPPTADPGKRLQ